MIQKKITKKTLKNFFIRQKDDYSCGPACLATIARLRGLDAGKNYAFFRELLGTSKAVGTHPLDIIDACKEHFTVLMEGEQVYHGGLALAYIVHQSPAVDHSAVDHYVVFLALKNDKIMYYDPYDDKIFDDNINNLKWYSTENWSGIKGGLKQWSVNFRPVKGLTFDFLKQFAVSRPSSSR